MIKHNIRRNKYKEEHHDKCKKKLINKILQGDIIEHPDYIVEKDLKIDYRYYLDHQIEKPTMQIFALTMKNPYSLIECMIRKDNNKKSGAQEITQWFKPVPTNNNVGNGIRLGVETNMNITHGHSPETYLAMDDIYENDGGEADVDIIDDLD